MYVVPLRYKFYDIYCATGVKNKNTSAAYSKGSSFEFGSGDQLSQQMFVDFLSPADKTAQQLKLYKRRFVTRPSNSRFSNHPTTGFSVSLGFPVSISKC